MKGEDGKGVEGRGVDGRSVVRTGVGVGVGAPFASLPTHHSPRVPHQPASSHSRNPFATRRRRPHWREQPVRLNVLSACAKHPDVARMLRSCDSMIRRPRAPDAQTTTDGTRRGKLLVAALKETPLNTLADAHLAFGVTHRVERARAA